MYLIYCYILTVLDYKNHEIEIQQIVIFNTIRNSSKFEFSRKKLSTKNAQEIKKNISFHWIQF